MKKVKILSLLLAIAMTMSLAACGGTSNEGTTPAADSATSAGDGGSSNAGSDEPVTITVGVNKVPTSFDILENGTGMAQKLVYESLFRYNPDTEEIEPWLAESYEWANDEGKTMRIKLRDNVYFSNGEKLTAEDVLYSYSRIADPQNASMQASYYMMYDYDNSYAEDELTVILTTYEPYGPGIANLARIPEIICKSYYENATPEQLWDHTCGTGPYMVVENISGSHTTLALRDDYWNLDAIDGVDTFIIRGYSEVSTMFIDFENGALDLVVNLDDSSYQRLLNGEVQGVTVGAVSEMELYYITLPEYVEVFDDIRIREAFTLAINWTVVGEIAMGSLAVPATSNLSSAAVPYYQNQGAYEHNPERAKELIAEAGYADGEIVLNCLGTNTASDIRINETIQAYLAEVGIVMNFESYESSAVMPRIAGGETDFFILTGVAGTEVPEPALLMQNCHAGSMLAPCKVTDEEYNSYWNQGLYSTDETTRIDAYTKCQEWLHNNYRHIPIMEYKAAYAYYDSKIASFTITTGFNADLTRVKLA